MDVASRAGRNRAMSCETPPTLHGSAADPRDSDPYDVTAMASDVESQVGAGFEAMTSGIGLEPTTRSSPSLPGPRSPRPCSGWLIPATGWVISQQ